MNKGVDRADTVVSRRRWGGDLHLRNILLYNGRPAPFDALEFDERLATIDTLYDLAFLIMDLCHRDLLHEAKIVLNEYFLRADERNLSSLGLMGLFICIRALIRVMTAAQTIPLGAVRSRAPSDRARQLEAESYLALAEQVLEPQRTIVVAVGGLSGSGKSTIARGLSTRIGKPPGVLLLNSDVERKVEFNVEPNHELAAHHYTTANADRIYGRLTSRALRAIRSHCPVVVDARFLTVARRTQFEAVVAQETVEFYCFWMEAPVDVMKRRILARHGDVSDADITVLQKQLARYTGENTWHHLDAEAPVDTIVERILKAIFCSRPHV